MNYLNTYVNTYGGFILCWVVIFKNQNNKCHHKKAIGQKKKAIGRNIVYLQSVYVKILLKYSIFKGIIRKN